MHDWWLALSFSEIDLPRVIRNKIHFRYVMFSYLVHFDSCNKEDSLVGKKIFKREEKYVMLYRD